ncbi:MAG: hypothetical protein ACXWT3_03120 [Methylococcaceae bacterium]
MAIGLGLAVLAAYGLALRAPFLVCVMAVIVLCKPGPPMPFLKAVVIALVLAALLAAGALMVPILENYALTGVLLTGAVLYGLFFWGLRSGNPLTMILLISFLLIPVVGVADQALIPMIIAPIALGIGVGALVNSVSHAFFPVTCGPAKKGGALPPISRDTASWIALRGTLVVVPVFVLALTNPSFYLAAIMKTVALGQQAGATNARSAGVELVGSTLMGSWMAAVVWIGLSLWPNLWMLMLWIVASVLWAGARLFGVKTTAFSPSFWSNALVTMLILLGPAIEDSANGKDVFKASAVRVFLFVGVALYVWGMVWVLERWRAARSEALFFKRS